MLFVAWNGRGRCGGGGGVRTVSCIDPKWLSRVDDVMTRFYEGRNISGVMPVIIDIIQALHISTEKA